MQRITIEKNEAVADLIERILEIEDQDILLVVPKGSRLTDSAGNFRLIARESNVLSKNITIESVDQEALAMAKAAGISANHPLFDDRAKAGGGQTFSDIMPRGGRRKEAVTKKSKTAVQPVQEVEPEAEEESDMVAVSAETEEVYEEETEEFPTARGRRDRDDEGEERYDTLEEPRRGRGRKILAWGIVLVVLILGGMWLTAAAFGKATVTIAFQKTPWTYNGTVTASVAAKDIDSGSATIPGELVEQPQNLPARSFPATGHTTGGQKARGMITIVNNYGVDSQELVATTRFLTPDGKLYRLDSGTIVPGAKVDATGKVIASSSIKAAVTADQPGTQYNIGPTAHLNIPGFQGTAKYNGFYGVLDEGTSGGSSTGGPAPTDDDIKNAKAQMTSALNSAFQATFLANVPKNFKVLPDALVFSTTTFSIGPVDPQGQFTVTPASVLHAFEFREQDVTSLLNTKAQGGDSSRELQGLTINYSNVTPNFTKKQMTFTVDAQGTLAPHFDAQAFAAGVAGKSSADARQAILALPDLADAKVSLWPAWLWNLPKDPSKITVQVQ